MSNDAIKAKYKIRITKINEGESEPFEVSETEGVLSKEAMTLLLGGDSNGSNE